MPRQGRVDDRNRPLFRACKGCGFQARNKSGYTQHVNKCRVLLEQRLRAARVRTLADEQQPSEDGDGPPDDNDGGWDLQPDDDDDNRGDGDRMSIDLDAGGGHDGQGAADERGEEDEEQAENGRRRVTRDFHDLMTGAFHFFLVFSLAE